MSSIRSRVIVLIGVVLIATAGAANAVSRQMGGVLAIVNPSVAGGQSFERPPSTQFKTIDVATPTGTAYTQVGNQINLAESVFPIGPGGLFRSFPNIVFVAQLTGTYFTPQQAAVLNQGGGAAAAGPITFCPPIATLVGGWTGCTFYASPNNPTNPTSNNRTARIHVEQAGNANAFGGVLSLIRGLTQGVWFVKAPFPDPPLAGKAAVVSRAPRSVTNPWPGGQENFAGFTSPRPPGPRYDVTLTTSGKINQFLTTPNCGTPPCPLSTLTTPTVGGESFGFRMTTGLVSQSDAYPPNNATTPFFFAVSQGADVTQMTALGGTNRNIVLLGGAIAFSPAGGGSNFLRMTTLRMTIPEPATGLGLAAGAVLLLSLVYARRRTL